MLKNSRRYLTFLLFILIAGIGFAQTSYLPETDTSKWTKIPLKFVYATVLFPNQTSLEKKDIYTEKGLQSLYYLKNDFQQNDMVLSVSMRQVNSKEMKKALQEEINRLAVQNGGYPNTYKEKDKANLSYEYVLIFTSDQKSIVSRIYYLDEHLIILTASYKDKNYQPTADYFLNSLAYNTKQTTENKEKNKPNQLANNKPWFGFKTTKFEAKFPVEPNQKTVVVNRENGTSYTVSNFYHQDEKQQLSYLISERNYDYKLDFDADSLFKLAFNTILAKNTGKIQTDLKLTSYKFPTKEYVFVSRKAYYRLRYIFANNTLYQVMLVGNKKQVFDLKNETFFSSFQVH